LGGGRVPGPPGCGLRPESCTGRKRGSRQRCVRMERAPEASAAHATAWAASSRLHARKVRWAAALKLRIRLGRVLLLPKFVGFKFFQRQVLKKGGVVADYWFVCCVPPLIEPKTGGHFGARTALNTRPTASELAATGWSARPPRVSQRALRQFEGASPAIRGRRPRSGPADS
jgi:hypothetical protein